MPCIQTADLPVHKNRSLHGFIILVLLQLYTRNCTT